MRLPIALALAGLLLAGCAPQQPTTAPQPPGGQIGAPADETGGTDSRTQPPGPTGSPAAKEEAPVAQPPSMVEVHPPQKADLFPGVPSYPLAVNQPFVDLLSLGIKQAVPAADVLGWYAAQLPQLGWKAEAVTIPPDRVRLFSDGERFLSISGFDLSGDSIAATGFHAIVRFHMRTTREITSEQAVMLARNHHRTEGTWTPTLIPDYESQRFGPGVRHPVWVVEVSPGNDAVWVDAITAEPFSVRQ